MIALHMSICAYTIGLYFRDRGTFILTVNSFYGVRSGLEISQALFGTTWLILIIEVPFFIGIGQLVVFHLYLICTRQSTFHYITEKQLK